MLRHARRCGIHFLFSPFLNYPPVPLCPYMSPPISPPSPPFRRWMHGFKHPNACSFRTHFATYLDTGHKGLAADDEKEDEEERAGQRELHGACFVRAALRWAG